MPCLAGEFCVFVLSLFTTTAAFSNLYYAIILAWETVTAAVKYPRTGNPPLTTNVYHSTLDSVHSILAPPGEPIEQLLLERANANARLVQALTLTNTFVDPAPDIHMEFVRHSRGLLRDVQTARGWARFREVCRTAVRQTLDKHSHPNACRPPLSSFLPPPLTRSGDPDKDFPFDHFVQIVVLRTIIVGLLNVPLDVEELDHGSLALITSHINDFWTLSKSGVPPPPHLSQELHDHLSRLIPPSTGFQHPINFVVPTWETMWRVCATTLAHIHEAGEYLAVFQEFIQKEVVTKEDFELVSTAGFSMRNFVEEVMRLHPPSKHITRLRFPDSELPPVSPGTRCSGILDRLRVWVTGNEKFGVPSARVGVREVADIKSVLQSEAIWSHDAHTFNPRRFCTIPHPNSQQTDLQKKALGLVFGYGPLRCVAASWAPMAATVISGTILSECREMGWEISAGPNIGERQGWDGWRLGRHD